VEVITNFSCWRNSKNKQKREQCKPKRTPSQKQTNSKTYTAKSTQWPSTSKVLSTRKLSKQLNWLRQRRKRSMRVEPSLIWKLNFSRQRLSKATFNFRSQTSSRSRRSYHRQLMSRKRRSRLKSSRQPTWRRSWSSREMHLKPSESKQLSAENKSSKLRLIWTLPRSPTTSSRANSPRLRLKTKNYGTVCSSLNRWQGKKAAPWQKVRLSWIKRTTRSMLTWNSTTGCPRCNAAPATRTKTRWFCPADTCTARSALRRATSQDQGSVTMTDAKSARTT